MDTVKVECFLAVAKYKSFSKAANILNKDQSVVSRQIQFLESELGVKLFTRNSHNVLLTPAGEIIEKGFERLHGLLDVYIENAEAAQDGKSGQIKIFTHAGCQYNKTLIPILLAFEKEYPDILIRLECAYSSEIEKYLVDKRADFVFWRWSGYANKNRDKVEVCDIENGILVNRNHPLAEKAPGEVTLQDFKDDRFIILDEETAPSLAARTQYICRKCGFEPEIIYAPDLDTAYLWVAAGRGIMSTCVHCICSENPSYKFITLEEFGTTELSFIHEKNNANPCLPTFLNFINERFKLNQE